MMAIGLTLIILGAVIIGVIGEYPGNAIGVPVVLSMAVGFVLVWVSLFQLLWRAFP